MDGRESEGMEEASEEILKVLDCFKIWFSLFFELLIRFSSPEAF
jgi:hypothetical protein